MSRYWKMPWSHATDNMAVKAPICPWCDNPDKRARNYVNGSTKARHLVRDGRAKLIKVNLGCGHHFATRTVCAHLCHEQ